MKSKQLARGTLVLVLVTLACGKTENIQPTSEGVAPSSSTTDASPLKDVAVTETQDVAVFDGMQEDAKPEKCPVGLPGPGMVLLPGPGGKAYCLDQTEVTQGNYLEFLEALGYPNSVDMTGQMDECSWNTSYVPIRFSEDFDQCWDEESGFFLSHSLDRPVGCVDFCDATAFCRWAGKRLCGRIGGGAVPATALTDAQESEWTRACTQGGTTALPYGDVFAPGRCVDKTYINGKGVATAELATLPNDCTGQGSPFDMIFNLVGNLSEWENGCTDGPLGSRLCPLRGGNLFDDDPDRLRCDGVGRTEENMSVATAIGFRCCADAI